jgi:hypothetical protein
MIRSEQEIREEIKFYELMLNKESWRMTADHVVHIQNHILSLKWVLREENKE